MSEAIIVPMVDLLPLIPCIYFGDQTIAIVRSLPLLLNYNKCPFSDLW